MTLEQASVALKHGLPVICTTDKICDSFKGEIFTITQLLKYKPTYQRKLEYSAQLTKNGRHYYTMDLYDIKPHPDYENAYNAYLDEQINQSLKYYLAILISEGGNKTTITKKVKELIDQIRNEAK